MELSVIVEGNFNPANVFTVPGDDFELGTSIEVSGGILADLHSVQVLPPKLVGDLSPGFGYFRFGKLGMIRLHKAKKCTITYRLKDNK
jgi:hypothetical protein